jgi:glycosyltransferase involved in cell wall biosynthesis
MTPRIGRVLVVVPSGTSFISFLRDVATEWRHRGGELAVAAGPDLIAHGKEAWPDGVARFDLPATRLGSPLGLVSAVTTLRRHVSRWKPDIVHAHFAVSAVIAAAARMTFNRRPIAWLATYHGMHLGAASSAGSRLLAAAEVWSARRMTLACVLNREDEASLHRTIPSAAVHRYASCGVGCDLNAFDPGRHSPAERQSLRSRLGIPSDAFVAIYVGRQVAFKGFAVAVRGFLKAEAAGLAGWLLLVGTADDAHTSGLTNAERRIVQVHPRIVRAGWQSDVSPFLAVADVMLLPSRREGMPVSAMESLAIGTPVITVNSRGCRDVVRDEIDGLVLAAADPELVASALLRCQMDPGLVAALKDAAVAGRIRFDRRHFVADQVALYSRFMSSGPSVP